MKRNTIIRFTLCTAICLLASKLPSSADTLFNLTIPNYSFESKVDSDLNGYLNQAPDPYHYNNLPATELFTGWESTGYLLQPTAVSAGAGYTGTFQGSQVAMALYTPDTIESLNPVATIIENATYTLTFAINAPSGAGSTTLQLLATSQALDTTDNYQWYPNGGNIPTTGPSPFPVITTLGVLASSLSPIMGGDTGAMEFKDYSVSFNTLNGNNASFVGDSLSINVLLGTSASVDNARLTEDVIPEPSTYAMMLGGLALLGFCVRRKRA
jgi:hypothetical protein